MGLGMEKGFSAAPATQNACPTTSSRANHKDWAYYYSLKICMIIHCFLMHNFSKFVSSKASDADSLSLFQPWESDMMSSKSSKKDEKDDFHHLSPHLRPKAVD